MSCNLLIDSTCSLFQIVRRNGRIGLQQKMDVNMFAKKTTSVVNAAEFGLHRGNTTIEEIATIFGVAPTFEAIHSFLEANKYKAPTFGLFNPNAAPIGQAASVISLGNMSETHLACLRVFYNDDFGIVDGDTLIQRAAKFVQWLKD